MSELGTTAAPVRLVAELNGREYELAVGDLEINIATTLDDRTAPAHIAGALRDLLADLVEQLTIEYETGDTLTTDQPISTCRIVLYRHYGTPGGEFPPKDSPALVTGIVDGDTVSLTVFTSDGGIHPHKAVRHDEDLAGGTWHWPPRVGPGGSAAPSSAYQASHPSVLRPGD
ncbi:hypothetical protein [Nonomuraea sp. NEAU-A123]|uniref:hypothetical protein n=1 Tax=Nonomuraea sp. NEAU-A123 TaxID=2839649 RepID=UPI001BE4699D|nr:hypothetical protein [Nonomuraea sp. NEAU-A123]MBT2226266.1 hypothetical protein [Nonomuraea sp. NEAU-A123]